jgi:hypothetical protein
MRDDDRPQASHPNRQKITDSPQKDHLRREGCSPFQANESKKPPDLRWRFSFDLNASLSLISFSWLSPSWALSLRIFWLTSWLSYRPSSMSSPTSSAPSAAKRGAEVRLDFNWNVEGPIGGMGYRDVLA